MKSLKVSIAILLGCALLGGCANTASFKANDGSYQASGRSSNPEAMMTTLSVNRAREINADAWATAVKNGNVYPNQTGPNGAYARFYCPNGVCISGAPAQQVAPAAQPAPAAAPAQQPVSREELERTQKQATEARKRADVALHILQAIRTEKSDDSVAEQH